MADEKCPDCEWPMEADGDPVGCGDEPACEMGECHCHDCAEETN